MRVVLLWVLLATAGGLHAVSVTDPRWGDVELQFATKVEPGGTIGSGIGGGVLTGPDRPHRLIFDAAEKRYFGYDLTVEPQGNQVFQIRIEPLNLTAQGLQERGINPGWAKMSLPVYPMIPAVRLGDTLAIDLLVNRTTGQKIVDYITVRRTGFDGALASGGTPRDFTLADVELDFRQPRISINGKPVYVSKPGAGGVLATVIYFYLPEKGRYLMSVTPNEKLGFRKAGVVARDGLTFKDGEVTYRVDCSFRIVPGDGLFNLYVLHDAWRPPGNDEFQVGGADKAEYLVHK